MEKIKDLNKEELVSLARDALPQVRFDGPHVWKGTITSKQLYNILKYVKAGGFVEDAIRLLDDASSLRQSVSYLVPSRTCGSEVIFEVVDTQKKGPSPHGYLGHVFTHNKQGNEVRQATLENLALS